MRSMSLAFCLLAATPSWAVGQQAAATPFWLLPKVDVDLRSLAPAPVKLVAGPDGSRKFIQEQRFSVLALREQSKSLQGNDFYSRFGRWFFADRDTRSSAPEP